MSSSSELGGLDAGPAADVVDSKTIDAVEQRIDAGPSADLMPSENGGELVTGAEQPTCRSTRECNAGDTAHSRVLKDAHSEHLPSSSELVKASAESVESPDKKENCATVSSGVTLAAGDDTLRSGGASSDDDLLSELGCSSNRSKTKRRSHSDRYSAERKDE